MAGSHFHPTMFKSGIRHIRKRIASFKDEVLMEPTSEFFKRSLRSDIEEVYPSQGEFGSFTQRTPAEEMKGIVKDDQRKYKDEIKRIDDFNKKVRMLRSRKTVVLPRKHWMVIQNGPPLQMQDLSVKAPSIFVEDNGKVEELLNKSKRDGNFDPLDETKPYWKRRDPKRRLEWMLPERPPTINSGIEVESNVPLHQRRVSLDEYNLQGELARINYEREKQACNDNLQDISGPRSSLFQNKNTNFQSSETALEHVSCLKELKANLPLDAKYTNGRRRRPGRRTPSDINPSAQMEVRQQVNSIYDSATGNKGLPIDSVLDPGAQLISELKKRALRKRPIDNASDSLLNHADEKLEQELNAALTYYPGFDSDRRKRQIANLNTVQSLESLIASKQASVDNFNLLIKSQSLSGDLKEARRTIQAMGELGFAPNEDSFVSLMQGAVTIKDAAQARVTYLAMRSLGIEAGVKTYATMIRAHVASRDLKSAFALLRKMEDEHVKADVVVYTALLDGCVKARDFKKAWEVFREARTWKLIEPDEVMFTVMIKACARQKNIEQALNILDDMRTSGKHPTITTYQELIRACSSATLGGHDSEVNRDREKYLRKAFEFFDQMNAEAMPIDHTTYQRLLESCAAAGDIKKAKTVLKEMKRNEVGLTKVDHDIILESLANNMRLTNITDTERAANVRNAWLALKSSQDAGHTVDVWTLNNLMKVYVNGGFAQHAVDMLDQYAHYGLSPNTQTFEVLLRMMSKDLKDPGRFFSLWDFMCQEAVTLSSKMKGNHSSLSFIANSPNYEDGVSEMKSDNTILDSAQHGFTSKGGDVRLTPYLLHLALDTAMDSKSASKVLNVLQQMEASQVWPTVRLTERLSKVGRYIPEVHEAVIRLIHIDRNNALAEVTRRDQLVKAQTEEHALREAVEGRTPFTVTVETLEKKKYFKDLQKVEGKRKPLTKQELQEVNKKGGRKYAEKVDRPKPNPYIS